MAAPWSGGRVMNDDKRAVGALLHIALYAVRPDVEGCAESGERVLRVNGVQAAVRKDKRSFQP